MTDRPSFEPARTPPSDASPHGFGTRLVADSFVPLEDVPGGGDAEIRCRRGHLVAKVTKKPEPGRLYTGREPVSLSDSVRVSVSAWDRVEGCPDEGLWRIDVSRLSARLKWRRGKLRLKLADVADRPPAED